MSPKLTNISVDVAVKFVEPLPGHAQPAQQPHVTHNTPTSASKQKPQPGLLAVLTKPRGKSLGKDNALFFNSLSMLLESGNGIKDSLDILSVGSKKQITTLCNVLSEQIDKGESLWKAMLMTGTFSAYSVAMIRVGESSGSLTDSLTSLAEHEDRSRALVSKTKAAMIYPSVVVGFMIILAVLTSKLIFPRLAKTFQQFDIQYTFPTKLLLWLIGFSSKYGLILIIFLVLVISVTHKLAKRFWKLKYLLDKAALSLPVAGQLMKLVEIERFGMVLSTLLTSGLSINSSLKTLAETTTLYPYKKLYITIERNLANGEPMSATLAGKGLHDKLLESTAIQLLKSGERSGSLPKTLAMISAHYRKRVELATETLDKALEPFLITLVAAGVGFLAISILLPIYSIFGSFNNQLTSNTKIKPTKALTAQEIALLPKVVITPKDSSQSAAGRQAPDTSGKIVIQLKSGDVLSVRSSRGGWLELMVNNSYSVWVSENDVVKK